MLIINEPRKNRCSEDKLTHLKHLGVNINGTVEEMEQIIINNGFGLPSVDGENFGFTLNYKYIRICIHYVDALAEELVLLKTLNLI